MKLRGLAILPLLLAVGAIATSELLFQSALDGGSALRGTIAFWGVVVLMLAALAGWIARAPGWAPRET